MVKRTETDQRLEIMNSILATPHRDFAKLIPIHSSARQSDPLFYLKLAHYYNKIGEVRDHKKVMCAAAATIDIDDSNLRELGQLWMRKMTPKDFSQTVDIALKFFGAKTGGKKRRLRKTGEAYLREMEQAAEKNSERFLRNKDLLRNLYQKLQIAPCPNAAVSLDFQDKSESGQPYEAFKQIKQLSVETDEAKICELIANGQIPTLQAFGAVKEVTPAIAVAIANKMSPKEIQNFIGMFEKRGLMADKEFNAFIASKLKKGASKLSMRGTSAAKSKTIGAAGKKVIQQSTDDFVKSLPPIKKRVLIAVDKSGSMENAIALGLDVAKILSAKVEDAQHNLMITSFAATAQEIPVPTEETYTQFETTFKYMRAGGSTSLGAALSIALRKKFIPETIVFITDGDENGTPFLESVVDKSDLYGTKIIACLLKGGWSKVVPIKFSPRIMKEKALEVENLDFTTGDYYGLPNLLKIIASGGMRETVQEIDNINIWEVIKQMKEELHA